MGCDACSGVRRWTARKQRRVPAVSSQLLQNIARSGNVWKMFGKSHHDGGRSCVAWPVHWCVSQFNENTTKQNAVHVHMLRKGTYMHAYSSQHPVRLASSQTNSTSASPVRLDATPTFPIRLVAKSAHCFSTLRLLDPHPWTTVLVRSDFNSIVYWYWFACTRKSTVAYLLYTHVYLWLCKWTYM